MKSKKILFISIIVLVVVAASFFAINKIKDKNYKTVKTSLGDVFLIMDDEKALDGTEREVTILDSKTQLEVAKITVKDKNYTANFKDIIDKDGMRCYEISNQLIYKLSNTDFKGVEIGSIESIDPGQLPKLIGVAKEIVAKKEWRWVKVCAVFLMNAQDMDMRTTLERYKFGQFTQEDEEINKDSGIKRANIQNFAEDVLKNYK